MFARGPNINTTKHRSNCARVYWYSRCDWLRSAAIVRVSWYALQVVDSISRRSLVCLRLHHLVPSTVLACSISLDRFSHAHTALVCSYPRRFYIIFTVVAVEKRSPSSIDSISVFGTLPPSVSILSRSSSRSCHLALSLPQARLRLRRGLTDETVSLLPARSGQLVLSLLLARFRHLVRSLLLARSLILVLFLLLARKRVLISAAAYCLSYYYYSILL